MATKITVNDKQINMVKSLTERTKLENQEEWSKIASKMPWLKFKPDWEVCIMPPFGFVSCRFSVKKGDKEISVYFDHLGRTGVSGIDPDNRLDKAFWEIYPVLQEDGSKVNERFAMHDTEGLLNTIDKELNR